MSSCWPGTRFAAPQAVPDVSLVPFVLDRSSQVMRKLCDGSSSNSWFFQPFLRILYDVDATSVLSCPLLLLPSCPLVLEDGFSDLSPCHLPTPQVIPTVCSLSPVPTHPHPHPSPGVTRLCLNWGLREILTFFKAELLRVKASGSARLACRGLEAWASWCPLHHPCAPAQPHYHETGLHGA